MYHYFIALSSNKEFSLNHNFPGIFCLLTIFHHVYGVRKSSLLESPAKNEICVLWKGGDKEFLMESTLIYWSTLYYDNN